MLLHESAFIPLGKPQVDALLRTDKNSGVVSMIRQAVQKVLSEHGNAMLVLDNGLNAGNAIVPYGKQTNNLLRSLKETLNELFQGNGSASITSDGHLHVSDKIPTSLQEADTVQKRFEECHIGEEESLLQYLVTSEMWKAYLHNALDRVHEKKHQDSKTYSFGDAEKVIRGCAGEVLLQHMLQCLMSEESYDPDEQSLQMLDRERGLNFPNHGHSPASYSARFTTRYNCELHEYNARKSHLKRRVTEFDAALLSGLEPATSKFSRLYAFDATLDRSEFAHKMFNKLNAIADFIEAMDTVGIQTHLFNVLYYRNGHQKKVERYGASANERNHAIMLPLLDTVDVIADAMQRDLQQPLEKLFPSKDPARHSLPSSPPTLPR